MENENKGSNLLRDMLNEEKSGLYRISLKEEFKHIETKAYEEYIPLLGHDKGSLSGEAHLRGVEEQICGLLRKIPEIRLSPIESFILLAAILFHDIGKIIDKQILDKESIFFNFNRSIFDSNEKTDGKCSYHHALISADLLTSCYSSLGFRDKAVVDCIAIVCASHFMKYAKKIKEEDLLLDRFLDQYGKIRIGWLCALLAIGDELDNSYHRVAVDHIKKENFEKGNLRSKLSGCEVDLEGKLLILHMERAFIQEFFEDGEKNEHGRNSLFYIWLDIINKKELLRFWYQILRQMHLEILDVVLSINDNLIGVKSRRAKKETESSESFFYVFRIEMASETIKTNLEEYLHKIGFSDSEIECEEGFISIKIDIDKYERKIEIIRKNIIEEKCDEPEILSQALFSFYSFQIAVEPTLRQIKIDRIFEAAIQLRFNSFGKTTFPWETLATEAGMEKESEVKLIFHRLLMLSNIYFQRKSRILNKFYRCLQKLDPICNTQDENGVQIVFTELDGEWSLNVGGGKESTKDNQYIKKVLKEFFLWVSKIVFQLDLLEDPDKSFGNSFSSFSRIQIKNLELQYLLDEKGRHNGVYFPASKSWLYEENKYRMGINLVITGPAGVGKSTLAMEFIAKGIPFLAPTPEKQESDIIGLSAYYSLEQPIVTIREIAKGLELGDNQILEFQHDFGRIQKKNLRKPSYIDSYIQNLKIMLKRNKNSPVLFLPRLAPRTYGNIINEEQLFWFRYRQISRLLEADREYCMAYRLAHEEPEFKLTTIVLDNLNAFSRNPLARQQVHQLFKMISWFGVLGIHIIENNPEDNFKVFATEVEFLADIVIKLDWIDTEYQYKVIEIAKSRCQQIVLGKHPFKIRRCNGAKGEGKQKDSNQNKKGFLISKSKEFYGVEIFPSIHTQVSKSEKTKNIVTDQKQKNGEIKGANFSKSPNLNNLVHKMGSHNQERDTGISQDAFIMLQGKPGGHKLAIGMSYIHGKEKKDCALVLNLGQPIKYGDVADQNNWWIEEASQDAPEVNKEIGVTWARNQKVNVDVYSPKSEFGEVFVLNFHAGFLLPEEFLQIVKIFIGDVAKRAGKRITRVLFNSTAHMPERYPLLDKSPLLLHALVRILKQQRIGLMIIGVEGIGRDERIKGLAAMADLKITALELEDTKLPDSVYNREELKDKLQKATSNVRILSSDNITGKDYEKRYGLFYVNKCGDKQTFYIEDLRKKNRAKVN